MSLNKVILIGNVGKDPDVRHFEGGNVIANVVLATNERGYKLPNGTEVPERTEWHNVVVRRDQANFVDKYVKKGSSLYVEGKIRTRDYEKDGIKRYVTEIIAERIEFYGSKRPESNSDGASSGAAASTPSAVVTGETFEGTVGGNSNDDLPF
jgi:single-strand DNA-binding protein